MEKLKRLPIIVKLVPLYLLIAAGAMVPVLQAHHHQQVVKADGARAAARVRAAASTTPALIQGKPVKIIMPRVGVDVAIVDGHYDSADRVWSVAHDTANYATNTPLASNQKGAPLIYGHWYDYVLGKTRDLRAGDIAFIYTDNNHVFKYTFTGSVAVNPTDTSVFNDLANVKGLRVLTCEGTWAQHRRIMNFNLVGAV